MILEMHLFPVPDGAFHFPTSSHRLISEVILPNLTWKAHEVAEMDNGRNNRSIALIGQPMGERTLDPWFTPQRKPFPPCLSRFLKHFCVKYMLRQYITTESTIIFSV
jgi:hypothetical protein